MTVEALPRDGGIIRIKQEWSLNIYWVLVVSKILWLSVIRRHTRSLWSACHLTMMAVGQRITKALRKGSDSFGVPPRNCCGEAKWALPNIDTWAPYLAKHRNIWYVFFQCLRQIPHYLCSLWSNSLVWSSLPRKAYRFSVWLAYCPTCRCPEKR